MNWFLWFFSKQGWIFGRIEVKENSLLILDTDVCDVDFSLQNDVTSLQNDVILNCPLTVKGIFIKY